MAPRRALAPFPPAVRSVGRHVAVGLGTGVSAAVVRSRALMVRRTARFMTAARTFVRVAEGQRCRAENQGAGEKEREINFHALECRGQGKNRRGT